MIAAQRARLLALARRIAPELTRLQPDIVVFDPEKTWTVNHEDLHMSAGYSCWDGWELTGKVRDTILRGTVLVENEQFVGPKTNGQFRPRTLLPEVRNAEFAFTSVAQ